MAAGASKPKTDRQYKSLKLQADVLRDLDNGVSREIILKTYGFKNQSNITAIKKRREKILSQISGGLDVNKKLIRKPMFPEIEQKLEQFVQKMNHKEGPLRRDLLKEQAAKFADEMGIKNFKASDGWISGFERRNNIACVTIHGDAGAVSDLTIANWKEKLMLMISKFRPEDVYNCDELGLFFKLLPDRTHAKKGSKCIRGKESKLRVTILLGANMTGTCKLDLLMIGKSENPRCFKSFRKANKKLPLPYAWNKKSWMTSDIFRDNMSKLNNKMRGENRKILMLLDNCPAHPKDMIFSNITVEFLPKNTTSVLQPCDQGIIRSFKCFYRKKLIQHVLLQIADTNTCASQVPIDLLQAMKWSLSAWQSVTKNTIVNCFRKAGFEKNDHFDSDTDVEDVQTDVLQTSTLFPAGVSFDEFATVDDDLVITDDVSDVIHSSDSESDEEIGERDVNPKPSKHDALNALRVLVRYNDFESFVRQDVVDKMERALLKHAIETMKETRITDYFQRQDKSMQ